MKKTRTPDPGKRFCWLLLTGLWLSAEALGQSKILATPGAIQIEGAAGGGLVPWAVIGGYGHEDEWGASAAITQVAVDAMTLTSTALLIGVHNRLELSLAKQQLRLDAGANADLAAATGGAWTQLNVNQEIVGAKLRVAGDLIYGELPQMAVGIQYKVNRDAGLATQVLGAHTDRGTDYYLSASKLYLNAVGGGNLLATVTARNTSANQGGLLGFGVGESDQAHWVAEFSLGWQWASHWLAGIEYRQLPDALPAAAETRWADAFVAWFPNKRVSVVAAYADLGDVALWAGQRGWYLSLQINN